MVAHGLRSAAPLHSSVFDQTVGVRGTAAAVARGIVSEVLGAARPGVAPVAIWGLRMQQGRRALDGELAHACRGAGEGCGSHGLVARRAGQQHVKGRRGEHVRCRAVEF